MSVHFEAPTFCTYQRYSTSILLLDLVAVSPAFTQDMSSWPIFMLAFFKVPVGLFLAYVILSDHLDKPSVFNAASEYFEVPVFIYLNTL